MLDKINPKEVRVLYVVTIVVVIATIVFFIFGI
jgi:phage shock protein PspC (stress-responsive transcriptional regulator)